VTFFHNNCAKFCVFQLSQVCLAI